MCTTVGSACAGGGGTCTAQCPGSETCIARPVDPPYCATSGTACPAGVSVGQACTAPGVGTCTASVQKRKPPPGTWGEQADPAVNTRSFSDVQPTSFQDNDPVRRPCIRVGHGTTGQGAEDVCNMDGTLGVVLPIPASDFITGLKAPAPIGGFLRQYPDTISSDAQNNFDNGAALTVLNCAPFLASKHSGECPNGDIANSGACLTPIITTTTSQQYTVKSGLPSFPIRTYLGANDARIYNLHMRNGEWDTSAHTIPYVNETIPIASGTAFACGDGTTCTTSGSVCPSDGSTCGLRLVLNFGGNFSRIHAASTVPSGQTPCQLKDATNRIGCLVQADHCSIGFGGDGANTWGQRNPGGTVASNISSNPRQRRGPERRHRDPAGQRTGRVPALAQAVFELPRGLLERPRHLVGARVRSV